MTLNLQIEGVRNIQGGSALSGQLQLDVQGSRAGWLISEVLNGVEEKWRPRFKVDCSRFDQLEFHLFKVNGGMREQVGFGGLNCSKFIKSAGRDLSDKSPNKYELNLNMREQHIGFIELWVLYNPYQLYEGQYCQKINLNMKVQSTFSIQSQSNDKVGSADINETLPVTNRYAYDFDPQNRPKRQIIKYSSQIRQNSPYVVPGQMLRSATQTLGNKSALQSQDIRRQTESQRIIVEQSQQSHRNRDGRSSLISGSRMRNGSGLRNSGFNKSRNESEIQIYKGPCRTVNAFSCMDQSISGQECFFTQAVLKRRS